MNKKNRAIGWVLLFVGFVLCVIGGLFCTTKVIDYAEWPIILIALGIIVFAISYGILFPTNSKEEKEKEEKEIQIEKEYAEKSQYFTEPWAKKYYTYPCPYCGHYKVRLAKWEDKSISVAIWGVASSKIGDNFKCEYCKKTWS